MKQVARVVGSALRDWPTTLRLAVILIAATPAAAILYLVAANT